MRYGNGHIPSTPNSSICKDNLGNAVCRIQIPPEKTGYPVEKLIGDTNFVRRIIGINNQIIPFPIKAYVVRGKMGKANTVCMIKPATAILVTDDVLSKIIAKNIGINALATDGGLVASAHVKEIIVFGSGRDKLLTRHTNGHSSLRQRIACRHGIFKSSDDVLVHPRIGKIQPSRTLKIIQEYIQHRCPALKRLNSR